MGSSFSVQTNYTKVKNSIENVIEQDASATSEIDCNISIGSITFTKNNGCSVTVENKCYAEADALLTSVQDIMVGFYNNLETDQKQEAATLFTATFGVTTNVTNIENDFKNVTNQTCEAEAQNSENIKIKNIDMGECNGGDSGLSLTFINTGTAKSQCAMEIVNKLFVQTSNDIVETQSQGLNWSSLIWPIVVCVIVVVICYIIINIITKKIPSAKERLSLEHIKHENYPDRIKQLLSIHEK